MRPYLVLIIFCCLMKPVHAQMSAESYDCVRKTLIDSQSFALGGTGIGGMVMPDTKAYYQLAAEGSDEQIKALFTHENPITRAFALVAFLEQNAEGDWFPTWLAHLDEGEKFRRQNGCHIWRTSIGDILYFHMKGKDNFFMEDKQWLTPDQEDQVLAVFGATEIKMNWMSDVMRTCQIPPKYESRVLELNDQGDTMAMIAGSRMNSPFIHPTILENLSLPMRDPFYISHPTSDALKAVAANPLPMYLDTILEIAGQCNQAVIYKTLAHYDDVRLLEWYGTQVDRIADDRDVGSIQAQNILAAIYRNSYYTEIETRLKSIGIELEHSRLERWANMRQ